MDVKIKMWIRLTRKARGIRLKELSAKTGISISDLSLIERGIQIPRLHTVVKIAVALDVSVEQLFDAEIP